MEPSALAQWLDTACAGFDHAVLGAIHAVRQSGADVVLTPLARLFDFLGEGGICLIILGFLLLAFPQTRRAGASVLLALALGAICTNVFLKPLTARPRPYDGVPLLRQWWRECGGIPEKGYSFPSGHSTAAMSSMSALYFAGRRRRAVWLVFPLLMALSRLYLVVHYPTDVIAGLLIGFAAGAAGAWFFRRD